MDILSHVGALRTACLGRSSETNCGSCWHLRLRLDARSICLIPSATRPAFLLPIQNFISESGFQTWFRIAKVSACIFICLCMFFSTHVNVYVQVNWHHSWHACEYVRAFCSCMCICHHIFTVYRVYVLDTYITQVYRYVLYAYTMCTCFQYVNLIQCAGIVAVLLGVHVNVFAHAYVPCMWLCCSLEVLYTYLLSLCLSICLFGCLCVCSCASACICVCACEWFCV